MNASDTSRERWHAIQEVVTALVAPVTPTEDIGRVLKITVTVTRADTANLYVIDETGEFLRLVASFGGRKGHQKTPISIRVDQGIAGHAFRSAQSILLFDVPKGFGEFAVDTSQRSAVSVPIMTGGRALGVLSLTSREENHFTHDDMDFLAAIASVVGIYLEKHNSGNGPPESPERLAEEHKEFAFVLMPFRDPFNKYYRSIIKPAIQKTDLVSIRADEIYRPSEIIKDIHEFIKKAKLIVAELTGKNPNVMYELGYSHAMGKTAVLITQTIDDVPFDLRGLRCITYDTTQPDWADALKKQITEFIRGMNRGR